MMCRSAARRRSACARVAVAAILTVVAGPMAGQTADTATARDVPRPVSDAIGLAGSPTPDMTRFLAVRSVATPTLSRDGEQLSFLTTTTGQPQVWITSLAAGGAAGGAPHQVTFRPEGVTAQAWSPGGGWIFYSTDPAPDARGAFYLISPDGLDERALLPPSAARRAFGGWSPDGAHIAYTSTERDSVDADVYVMDIAADGSHRPPRRVLNGIGVMRIVSWRPDGAAILVARERENGADEVFLLDLAHDRLDSLFTPAVPATYRGFAWTPDGRGLYVATNQGRDVAGLAYYDLRSHTLSWIGGASHDVEDVAVSHDGRWLAWVVNDAGWSALHLLDLRGTGRQEERPPVPAGVYHIAWAPDASILGVHVAAPSLSGDEFAYDPSTRRLVRVTRSSTAGLDAQRFAVPDTVSFPGANGDTIFGLLYRAPPPPPPPRRAHHEADSVALPSVVIHLHDGPAAQARPVYDPLIQWLLTRDITVLDLNYRGSTGYGKRYTQLDDGRSRRDAIADVAAALDWLGATRAADTSRAAVVGRSYGGYLALAAASLPPGRFRSAVDIAGATDLVSMLAAAPAARRVADRAEFGNVDDPDDRAFLLGISPLSRLDSIAAPLLIVQGARDAPERVADADRLVDSVRARGGEVEYLRFPDEAHDLERRADRITAYSRIADFLERTLVRKPESTP